MDPSSCIFFSIPSCLSNNRHDKDLMGAGGASLTRKILMWARNCNPVDMCAHGFACLKLHVRNCSKQFNKFLGLPKMKWDWQTASLKNIRLSVVRIGFRGNLIP